MSCPERSDPGKIIENMGSVPRIVGGLTPESTDLVAALYEAAFAVKTVRLSDPKTANAVKLTENLFRDVNIALANEFALLYEKLGVDAIEVINACASKYNFMPHYPGTGVGGPCILGSEFVFLADVNGLTVTSIGDYVDQLIGSGRTNIQQWGRTRLVRPEYPILTLAFDGERSKFEKVSWFSIRRYKGKAIRFKLTSNRNLTVTQDHPMLVKTAWGIVTKPASQVKEGDEIPLSLE